MILDYRAKQSTNKEGIRKEMQWIEFFFFFNQMSVAILHYLNRLNGQQ